MLNCPQPPPRNLGHVATRRRPRSAAVFAAVSAALFATPPAAGGAGATEPGPSAPRDGDAGCRGVVCGERCRPPLFGCTVLLRSQTPDRCSDVPPGIACGPRAPGPEVDHCDIGVLNRELVGKRRDCTAGRFERMTAAACAAYRKKNGRRPLDEFDPSVYIHVSQLVEHYDVQGNVAGGRAVAETHCPPVAAGPRTSSVPVLPPVPPLRRCEGCPETEIDGARVTFAGIRNPSSCPAAIQGGPPVDGCRGEVDLRRCDGQSSCTVDGVGDLGLDPAPCMGVVKRFVFRWSCGGRAKAPQTLEEMNCQTFPPMTLRCR